VSKVESSGIYRSADAAESNTRERSDIDRNAFTALWTTLSGFESLPPSHQSFFTTTIYDPSRSERISRVLNHVIGVDCA